MQGVQGAGKVKGRSRVLTRPAACLTAAHDNGRLGPVEELKRELQGGTHTGGSSVTSRGRLSPRSTHCAARAAPHGHLAPVHEGAGDARRAAVLPVLGAGDGCPEEVPGVGGCLERL